MSARLRVTVLGCGSSGGVPRVGNEWGACDPNDSRNRRTRCSLLIERYEGNYSHETSTVVLIDTSPDLREQLLAAHVSHIEGLLYTHDHADQSHGIDDLRALVYNQRRRIPTYMDEATARSLLVRFSYVFQTPNGSHYPALLDYVPMPSSGECVSINGPGGTLELQVLAQNHGDIDSLGFRFGPVAYCNDCKILPEVTLTACRGVDLFIVDALRDTVHPSHATVEQALEWAASIKPKHTILTNMHIDLDYLELSKRLPEGVEPAIDGLVWDGAV